MEKPMLTTDTDTDTQETELSPNWEGKDKATVPLFFAQTLIQSLRDVGAT